MMSDTLLTAKVVHAPSPILSNSPSPVGRFRTGTGRSIPLRSGRHRLSPQARVRRLSFLAFLVCLPLIVVACSTPVGVKRIDPRAVHRTLTTSVLSADTFSTPTRNVLYRRDLFRGAAFTSMGAIPTAVHNMTPGTRFIRTLAVLPVAPGVAATVRRQGGTGAARRIVDTRCPHGRGRRREPEKSRPRKDRHNGHEDCRRGRHPHAHQAPHPRGRCLRILRVGI